MTAEVSGTKAVQVDSLVEGELQRTIQEKVHDFEHQLQTPLGEPTEEQIADYAAKWGDFVIMNGSDLVMTLPLGAREDAGRTIAVKNRHASSALTVRPAGEDTIDGSTSDLSVAADKAYCYVCQGDGAWIELWR